MKIKIKEKRNKKASKERKPQDESTFSGSDNFKKRSHVESRNNLVVRKQLTHLCKFFIERLEPEHIHVVQVISAHRRRLLPDVDIAKLRVLWHGAMDVLPGAGKQNILDLIGDNPRKAKERH